MAAKLSNKSLCYKNIALCQHDIGLKGKIKTQKTKVFTVNILIYQAGLYIFICMHTVYWEPENCEIGRRH